MALDSSNLIVANSGHGYIAPVGTALPTAEDSALNAAFVELGYFSEGGSTITVGREKSEIFGWQSRTPLRSSITKEITSIAFEMQEWNPTTTALALGGGEWTEPTPDHFWFTPATADEGTTSYAFVLDWSDEGGVFRFLTAKVELAGDVSIALQRDSAAVLPVSLTVLDTGTSDAYNLATDLVQFAPAS